METLRGTQLTLSDGSTLMTEVVSDEDAHLCLYVLLQDMLKVGDMVVGVAMEWGFKGISLSRSGSSSGKHGESVTSDNKSDRPPKRVEHFIAVLTLCTKFGCVVIRLSPGSMSPSLKRFFAIKDITFVGLHVKEDLDRLKTACALVFHNMVELSDLAAKVYDQPRFVAFNARDLSNKIASTKLDSKSVTVLWCNWFEPTLSAEQVECTSIDAYAVYRIGKKLMESGKCQEVVCLKLSVTISSSKPLNGTSDSCRARPSDQFCCEILVFEH